MTLVVTEELFEFVGDLEILVGETVRIVKSVDGKVIMAEADGELHTLAIKKIVQVPTGTNIDPGFSKESSYPHKIEEKR